MNPITTNTLNKNNVMTTRYFNNGTVYADFLKTSDGQLYDVKNMATEIELDDIREDINNHNIELVDLNSKINNLQGDVELMSIDIQTDLFSPLYTSPNEISRMSGLTSYISSVAPTPIDPINISSFSIDPFMGIINVDTTISPNISFTFESMKTHPFNNVSTLTDLKSLSYGSVQFVEPVSPISTTILYYIMDSCDRYFDFTLNLNEINLSTSLSGGVPIFIPDRITNVKDGIVYKLRKLIPGGTFRGFNPLITNVGNMYLFIRNVMKLQSALFSNVFAHTSAAWSANYLHIILCGEIGMDSYDSSQGVPYVTMQCKALYSPGRPSIIYSLMGVFINNWILITTPGMGPIDFSHYLRLNCGSGSAKTVGTIKLPYGTYANAAGGLKEGDVTTSLLLTNNNYATFSSNALSYFGFASEEHRFYSYVLYLAKI